MDVDCHQVGALKTMQSPAARRCQKLTIRLETKLGRIFLAKLIVKYDRT